jgi:L-threonylcarbamoyladenylate synthase
MKRVSVVLPYPDMRRGVEPGLQLLVRFGVEFDVTVADVLRASGEFLCWLRACEESGSEALLAFESGRMQIASFAAGYSVLPVIAVPMPGGDGPGTREDRVVYPSADVPEFSVVPGGNPTKAVFTVLRFLGNKYPELRAALEQRRERQVAMIVREAPDGLSAPADSGARCREAVSKPQPPDTCRVEDNDWLNRVAQDFQSRPRTARPRLPGAPRGHSLDYSRELRAVISTAREIAAAYGNEFVTTLHYLAALIDTPSCAGSELLRRAGGDLEQLAHRIVEAFPPVAESPSRAFAPDSSATGMVRLAKQIARSRLRKALSTADFLEAILRQADSRAAVLLLEAGVTGDVVARLAGSGDLVPETLPESVDPKSEQRPEEPITLDAGSVVQMQSRLFGTGLDPSSDAAGRHDARSEAVEKLPFTPGEKQETDKGGAPGKKALMLKCDPLNPGLDVIERTVDALLEGKAVAFPTDTVYGVGVDATNPSAVESLYALKSRPPGKAIATMIHSVTLLKGIVAEVPAGVEDLLDALWPGPLTVVFPRRQASLSSVSVDNTIGIRIPDHYVALAILSMLGRPLAVTSANVSGGSDSLDAQAVAVQFGGQLAMILDGGRTPGARSSTVLSVVERPFRIIRAGAIPRARIEALLGDTVLE